MLITCQHILFVIFVHIVHKSLGLITKQVASAATVNSFSSYKITSKSLRHINHYVTDNSISHLCSPLHNDLHVS